MQEVEKEFSMPQMMDPSFDLGKLTEDPFAELENIGDVNFDISQFLAGPVVPVADGTVSITNEFLDSNQILEFQTDETFESNFQQIIENIVNVPLPTEEVTSDKKRKRTEGKNVSNFGKQFTIKRLNTTRV